MRVTKNCLVKLHYTLSKGGGELIDEAPTDMPFELQCGTGQLVPGFERGLMGLRAGDKKEFVISPSEAYGDRRDELVKKMPKHRLPAGVPVKEGMRFPMKSPEGVDLVCRILKVQNDEVVADFNHPLAGEPLHCKVNVLEVRQVGSF
jgi:FKBP-type peptidyl-prolyl cis-trans isomerase 2